jgi:hypothetical protein
MTLLSVFGKSAEGGWNHESHNLFVPYADERVFLLPCVCRLLANKFKGGFENYVS